MSIATSLPLSAHAGITQATGPTAYRQFSDSLFGCIHFTALELEDFEDHAANSPGLVISDGFITSSVFASARDSVDLDDGDLNELSFNNAGTYLGDSWYVTTACSFTFDAGPLGGLPTHAGLVLTDATFAPVTVAAFDELGRSFATVVYQVPDAGESACGDDYFIGFFSASGISRIDVSVNGEVEVDHVQYGRSDLGAESDLDRDGLVSASDLAILLANWGSPCVGELTGDFVIDAADLAVLLANWS